MYQDAKKRRWWLLWLAAGVLALALILLLLFGGAGKDARATSAAAIEAAVRESAQQCYAVEGVYPPDLAYLQAHYGLQVNTASYFVVYEAFSSNLPPDVRVIPKQP